MTATGAIRELFETEDRAAWFRRLDEGIIKPTLLLDQSNKGQVVEGLAVASRRLEDGRRTCMRISGIIGGVSHYRHV